MIDIEIKGDIIEDDNQWIYDWIGWNYTSPKNVINQLKQANGQPITLKINSQGGSVFAASEIYTELREYKGEVNIQIVGLAASAASVIAMAGRSSMSPTAQLMVHNVSTSASGDYRAMDHASEILKNANDTIANAYIAKSGMSREQALELMNNETYLSAQKAKELGLIDEIMFEENSTIVLNNKVDMGLYNSFSSIPKEILNLFNKSNNNQPIANKSNMVDIFMQQKAQSELDFLKLGGKINE